MLPPLNVDERIGYSVQQHAREAYLEMGYTFRELNVTNGSKICKAKSGNLVYKHCKGRTEQINCWANDWIVTKVPDEAKSNEPSTSDSIRGYCVNTSDRTDEKAQQIIEYLESIGEFVYPAASFRDSSTCSYFYHDGDDWCGSISAAGLSSLTCQQFIDKFIPKRKKKLL